MKETTLLRREFLTVYDYGSGGVWCYINAPSVAALREQFRQLQVLEPIPPNIAAHLVQGLIRPRHVEIDDYADEYLNELRKHL